MRRYARLLLIKCVIGKNNGQQFVRHKRIDMQTAPHNQLKHTTKYFQHEHKKCAPTNWYFFGNDNRA